ncbi:transcriptional repressor, partial [Staphylococcus saprophyticus]|uniref:transcriptional repressor n=1 Tax=Staphylococcus saprophyticus TaxID=29385 RepID=UPI0021B27E29
MKNHPHKYTNKTRQIIHIFLQQHKYINPKIIQQKIHKNYPPISFHTIYTN